MDTRFSNAILITFKYFTSLKEQFATLNLPSYLLILVFLKLELNVPYSNHDNVVFNSSKNLYKYVIVKEECMYQSYYVSFYE